MRRALRLVSVQRGHDLRELRADRLRRRRAAPRRRARAEARHRRASSCRPTPASSPRSAAWSRRCGYDAVQTLPACVSTRWDAKVVADPVRARSRRSAWPRSSTRAIAPERDRGAPKRRPSLCRARTTSSRWTAAPAISTALRRGFERPPPPALRLCDGRERRVREPARVRAGVEAASCALGSSVADGRGETCRRASARSSPRRRAARAAAVRARRRCRRASDLGPGARRRRVGHDPRLSGPALLAADRLGNPDPDRGLAP